jgi:hypothetical protein
MRASSSGEIAPRVLQQRDEIIGRMAGQRVLKSSRPCVSSPPSSMMFSA